MPAGDKVEPYFRRNTDAGCGGAGRGLFIMETGWNADFRLCQGWGN